jgi:hypothetical protein
LFIQLATGRYHLQMAGNKVTVCLNCKKTFSNPSNLKKHLKKFHPDEIKEKVYNFSCGICGRHFSYKKKIGAPCKNHPINPTELINLGFYSNSRNFWIDFTSRVTLPAPQFSTRLQKSLKIVSYVNTSFFVTLMAFIDNVLSELYHYFTYYQEPYGQQLSLHQCQYF